MSSLAPASTPAPTRPSAPAPAHRGTSNPIAIGLDRIRVELLQYVRQPDALFFNFAFPIMLLLIFGAAFAGFPATELPDGTELGQERTALPAMITAGLLLSGVQNLGIGIAIERWDGTLQRLSAMPMPVSSYFIGKFGQVLISALIQLVTMLVIGRFLFGFALPETATQWGVFVGMWLLGLACMSLLGVLVAHLPQSVGSATGVIIPIVLVVQFISGLFIPMSIMPEWMIAAASVLPVMWIGHAMRFAFLPEAAQALELGQTWNLPLAWLIVGAWTVAALVGALLVFRWVRRS